MKKHKLYILVSILIMLVLSGCDPHNPMGVRTFGTIEKPIIENVKIIALEPAWGPGGVYQLYLLSDGGFSWKTPASIYSNWGDIKFLPDDCTQTCEFSDPINDTIRYQIIPGKTLLRSLDSGNTWNVELQVPAWNQMEKNYVNYKFQDIGRPRDVRGPYSAITDPETGNLIAAMGFEGALVRPATGKWIWVNVDRYSQIHPSRNEMIGLIRIQEWVKGFLIALFLILLGSTKFGINKFPVYNKILLFLVLWLILIPIEVNLIIIALIFHWPNSQPSDLSIYQLIPSLVIFLGLIPIIILKIKTNEFQYRMIFVKIVSISILGAISYWSSFIMWSQGIMIMSYTEASLIGIALFFIALFVILFVIRKNPIHSIEQVMEP